MASKTPAEPPRPRWKNRETTMFATIKSLIPEPRQADQPHRYVGRHRQPDGAAGPVPEIHVTPDESVSAGSEHHLT